MQPSRLLLALAVGAGVASALPSPPANTTRREMVRLVVGGGGVRRIWVPGSEVLELYRGYPAGSVKVITSAGTNPVGDGASLVQAFADAGVITEWIPVHDVNCNARVYDDEYVRMVRESSAIFFGGGQSGRLQSCMYGAYSQSGIDCADGGCEVTPFLQAILDKELVGGSSAGAMNQPMSEILVTAHSVESYQAVSQGSVFQRDRGNLCLEKEELVDTHFSERGRQGRLVMIAMQTQQRWAFGCDEDSAYIWRPSGEYEVVGEAEVNGQVGGVVIYQDTEGNAESQRATMHFLTSGDRINHETGAVSFNPDKQNCRTGQTPPLPSSSVFDGRTGNPPVPYRTIALAMSQLAQDGAAVMNFHGNPPVAVRFTTTSNTVAMCGPSGQSFTNLLVEQFRTPPGMGAFNNTVAPALPQDHVWLTD